MAFQLAMWSDDHVDAFCAMHRDPDVMADLGGPIDREESEAKLNRYRVGWVADGISRWVVVDGDLFLGYAGVVRRRDTTHPLGVHYEVGWRFCRRFWGRGIATGSARIALEHAWKILDVPEIVSYTASDNHRSQGVMTRLSLRRDPQRDFTAVYPGGPWQGLVWIADRPQVGVASATPSPRER